MFAPEKAVQIIESAIVPGLFDNLVSLEKVYFGGTPMNSQVILMLATSFSDFSKFRRLKSVKLEHVRSDRNAPDKNTKLDLDLSLVIQRYRRARVRFTLNYYSPFYNTKHN